jgi:hypothetical protein
MNVFETSASQSADWLFFGVMLLAIGLGITLFVVWFYWSTKSGKKKKRKRRHRHDRRHNPTLAETGGLPPVRQPDQPPKGV